MKIRILSPAIDDIGKGRAGYETRSEGLGSYFMDSMFGDIDSLILYAGIHSMHHGYYRMIAKRFPYAIYYKLEDETVIIYRILDCRRNPKWIIQQLEK